MSTLTAAPRPTSDPTRTPWTVHVLGTITLLLALVTSYGAIYFSFFFEDAKVTTGSVAFAIGFIAINVVAAGAALGLWRGRRAAWQVLVGYGVLGILWCIAKLVFWSETEALVFGVANVLALAMLAAPRTREHASR